MAKMRKARTADLPPEQALGAPKVFPYAVGPLTGAIIQDAKLRQSKIARLIRPKRSVRSTLRKISESGYGACIPLPRTMSSSLTRGDP